MKKIILLLIVGSLHSFLFGQSPEDQQAVLLEGYALFKSEMASWKGTDLFREKFPHLQEQAGGYFSYTKGNLTNCIFFSNEKEPDILVQFSFEQTFNPEEVSILTDRKRMTDYEYDIFQIRKTAIEYTLNNSMFKTYENTTLNFIPLIEGGEKKVFILTGPQQTGIVIFGNDYLINFNDNNEITAARQLHQDIIGIPFEPGKPDQLGGVHTHSKETGELITSTDICTLMLYSRYGDWSSHIVMAPNYVNLWSCKTNQLEVLTKKEFDKIYMNGATEAVEEQTKSKKKKSKKTNKKNKRKD